MASQPEDNAPRNGGHDLPTVSGTLPKPDFGSLKIPAAARSRAQVAWRPEWLGLALLTCAVAFNAVYLAPEVRIGRVPPNDAVLHLALSERLIDSFRRGEPFLDPWVSEWGLGYPVWRSYQVLPHVLAGGVLVLTERFADHATAFASLQYALLVLLPVTAYVGARLMGVGPPGAGIASLLIFSPASQGELGWVGLSYGATTWRGSGLFTQLVAVHMLLLCLGVTVRALDTGRARPFASGLLAATALSHLVFGYVAFVSAALLAVVGPRGERVRRCVRLATIVLPALFLLAWFLIPLFLASDTINHSRWEAQYKWDSFGAAFVLGELVSGRFFDGGRWPLLSLLVLLGAVLALVESREALPRRLLALSTLWLALFFGRPTWGRWLMFAGIVPNLHLHRLQAAFEIPAILLAASGVDCLLRLALHRSRRLTLVLAAGTCVVMVLLATDRARYLQTNARMGEASLAQYEHERPDLERALAAVKTILAECPGRVSAGKAATWGTRFRVGDVAAYAFLSRAHLDQASFLYHSMSQTSDVMVLRDEGDAAHDNLFAIRAVLAPDDLAAPPHLRERGHFGRFKVYESSREGYFGLVDVAARYVGPRSAIYDENAAWLRSPLVGAGVVVALGEDAPQVPARANGLPPLTAELLAPRGRILEETMLGETRRARLELQRAAYALVKITWDPFLVAAVDGVPAPVVRVTPGFAAVPVAHGIHEVTVYYAPGSLRPVLFFAGVGAFALCVLALTSRRVAHMERVWGGRLATFGARLSMPEVIHLSAVVLLAVLALRPLFSGRLIDGHDTRAYPPRLVEFMRVVHDRHLPPVWAPDLGSGYGNPLFEFAPPLLYAVASAFHAAGSGLTDALQFALASVYIAGAVAFYRLGRRFSTSRTAALGGAAAWLFAPYVALDLYVRAAFAEAIAVGVVPIALLGLVAALDQPSALRVVMGAAAVALVPLAHNAVAFLLLPVFALVVVVRRSLRACLVGGGVLVGALGLSAFFWLPALVENAFTKTHLLREGWVQWSLHAVAPRQLVWSAWGYGLSVPGLNDGMSFSIGPLHLVLAALGLMVILRSWRGPQRWEALTYAVGAAAGAWLATPWSAPVWERLVALQNLQFPWRALFLPATFLPLLMVPAFDRIGRRACVGAIAAVILLNLSHTTPKGFLAEADPTPQSIARSGTTTSIRGEYEPRWVEQHPPETPHRLLARDNSQVEVTPIAVRSAAQEFVVFAPAEAWAEASTFYYPGWRVRIDGREELLAPIPGRGTMTFRIPAGIHHVTLDLQPTPLRRNALRLSGATAVVLFGSLLLVSGARWRRGRIQ